MFTILRMKKMTKYTHQEMRHLVITMLNMMQYNGMIEGYSDDNPKPTDEDIDEFVRKLLEVLSEEPL